MDEPKTNSVRLSATEVRRDGRVPISGYTTSPPHTPLVERTGAYDVALDGVETQLVLLVYNHLLR